VSVVALTLLGAPAHAQSRLRTDVDTTLVTVGDRIDLTVRVEHAADASVSWPDSLDLSPFEVLGARLQPTAVEDGVAVSTAVFSLAAFELGELEIPAFEVAVLRADGERDLLETDRFGVEVVSVGADEGDDIREIRGPLTIPVSAVRVALWGILFMLLGAALWAGYRRWRESRTPVQAVLAGPPPRPPHEIALEALDALRASPLLERGEVKEFHVLASDAVRRYVEAVFSVPSLELTTGEVMRGLEEVDAPGEARVFLRRFLDRCDLVKFAKVRPDEATALETLELGRAFVEQTVGWRPPRTEPPETPQAPAQRADQAVDEADAEATEADPVVSKGAGEVA
jgi:hypothetical protein